MIVPVELGQRPHADSVTGVAVPPCAPAGRGCSNRNTQPQKSKKLSADSLNIAGMIPLSTVDWPGKLVASLFLQGCPWRCPYCHNHDLIPVKVPGQVSWGQVVALLQRRRGMLDGVVFSGGEATLQPALPAAMRQVKERGYLVGLHSAGAYPRRLKEILDSHLVDWLGLDVKALPENYERVAGVSTAGTKAWESLRVALAAGVDLEVRITVFPDGPRDAVEVARHCRKLGVENLALQVARSEGAPQGFVASDIGWQQWHRDVSEQVRQLGFTRFEYRS